MTDTVIVEPHSLNDPDAWTKFVSVCNAYIDQSGIAFDGRERPDFMRRLHLASHGYAGRAFKMLRHGAEQAVGSASVAVDHLAAAWKTKNGFRKGVKNPFLMPRDELKHFQNREDYAAILDERDTPPARKGRR